MVVISIDTCLRESAYASGGALDKSLLRLWIFAYLRKRDASSLVAAK
jgi:hypothetical protein